MEVGSSEDFSKPLHHDQTGVEITLEDKGMDSQVSSDYANKPIKKEKRKNQQTVCEQFQNCRLVSYNTRIYSKTLRAHSSVEEERKRHLATFPSTIHPYSDLRWYGDIFVTVVLLVTLAAQPIQIAFYSASMAETGSAILSGLISVFFFVDIFMNFKTGFLQRGNDDPILDTRAIAKHYLKTWFFIDLISSIPYDCIYATINDIEGTGQMYLKYFRMLELLKILRLARVIKYLTRIQEAFEMKNVNIRITNLVTMIFFLIHWLGCLHYLVADLVNSPPHKRGELSWISQMEIWDHPVWEKYAHSVLRAMSNMACLGYGFVTPRAPEDVLCTITSILVGAFCFALFIANMSNIILNLDTSTKQYSKTLDEVREYMQYKRVPKKLQERVINYFEQRYRRKLFNENEIFVNVSDVLRRELQMFNCKQLVQQVPLFQGIRVEILEEIVAQLQFEVYLPHDIIINANTIGYTMYFIQHGTVNILTSAGKVVGELSDGNFFGEMAMVTNNRRSANVVATTSCDVYRLEKFHFERVIKQYPEVYESIVQVAKSRFSEIRDLQSPLSLLEDYQSSIPESAKQLPSGMQRKKRISVQEVFAIPLCP